MNFLDVRTIMFNNLATDVIATFVIILLWLHSRKRFSGSFFWVLDFCFQTTAILLILLRGTIPDWASMVLSNTLVVAGALLGYMGLIRFVGKTIRQIHNYVLLAMFPLVQAYFDFIQPYLQARTLILSIAMLILFFQCAWFMLRSVYPELRRITRGVGVVFGLFGVMSVIQIIFVFSGLSPEKDFFKSGLFEMLILVSYQLLFILLAYRLTLMVNRRLLMEIQSQEEKFTKAFHSSPYAITLTRLSDGRIIEVNDGFVSITGYQRPEVIRKTTPDLHLWARAEDRDWVTKEISETGKMPGREFLFRKKSGELLTGLFSAEIFRVDRELLILSSINDITDRKKTEEALRESEERYREVVENANEAILVAQDGIIKFHNPKTMELSGYLEDEMSNKPFVEFIYPEDRGLVLERYQKRLAGEILPQVYPFRIITKQGQTKWVEINAVVMSWKGKPATLNFLSDITERKEMEEQLKKISIMDDLTGLYNRRGFLTLAQQQHKVAERTKKEMLLFFADVDNMKWINDTLGHQEGDKALMSMAELLRETFRDSDIIGRIGGDEFAILALDTMEINPDTLTSRLQSALVGFNREETRPFRLSLSIGMAGYSPDHPLSIDQLIAEADRLMYEQKRKIIISPPY